MKKITPIILGVCLFVLLIVNCSTGTMADGLMATIVFFVVALIFKKKKSVPLASFVPMIVWCALQSWMSLFDLLLSDLAWENELYFPLLRITFAISPICACMLSFVKEPAKLANKMKYFVLASILLSLLITSAFEVRWDNVEFYFCYFVGIFPSVVTVSVMLLPSMNLYLDGNRNESITDDAEEKVVVFCRYCGGSLHSKAVICPTCGCETGYQSQKADTSNSGLNFLSFMFPIVGLIMYLCMKEKSPIKANSIGRWALVSEIMNVFGWIIILLGEAM